MANLHRNRAGTGPRGLPGRRRRAAILVAATALGLLPGAGAWAQHGTEAGLAVRPGWPQVTADPSSAAPMDPAIHGTGGRSGWFRHSSPTLVDLDGDGVLDIVIGSLDGRVYAYRGDGTPLPGWPRRLDAPHTPAGPVSGTPAAGDLDGDGRPEVVAGSDNGWVFAFAADGTIKPGWPRFTGNSGLFPDCSRVACTGVVAGPTLVDLDSDGRMEVIAGSLSHLAWVWRGDGSVLPGWPRDLGGPIRTSAAVGDVDTDGSPDIVLTSDATGLVCGVRELPAGFVHALRTDGQPLRGSWPATLGTFATSSPVLASVAPEGGLQVIVGGGPPPCPSRPVGRVTILRADGATYRVFDTVDAGDLAGHVAAADLTGDGRAEMAVGFTGGLLRLVSPDLTVTWERWASPTGGPNGSYFGGPVLADVTGDGVPEVVAADGDRHVKAWNLAGELVADSALLGPGVTRHAMWNSPAVGDVDGDGKNEIVVGSAAADGPAGSHPFVAAGRGELWVFDTNGVGRGPFAQYHSRVRPGDYRLYGDLRCTSATPVGGERPAVSRGGFWFFRTSLTTGPGEHCVVYGNPDDIPVMGDWNNDGIDTPGVFRPSEGRWYLTNALDRRFADGVFQFGSPGDIPVVGDWNGDGTDTLGVFRPSEGKWYLTNFFDRGVAEMVFTYGNPDDTPVVGDWNGDGRDTIGVYRGFQSGWYLTNVNDRGTAETVVTFGTPGLPVVGDWDGDGRDGLGVFVSHLGRWELTNGLGGAGALPHFVFGTAVDRPLHWG